MAEAGEPGPRRNHREIRILELTDIGDGLVQFTVDSLTTHRDFMATLKYIQPDDDKLTDVVRDIFRDAIEDWKVLSGTRLEFMNPDPTSTEPIFIDVADNSSMEDLFEEFQRHFGVDGSNDELAVVFRSLINGRKFDNRTIVIPQANEMAVVDPDALSRELLAMRHEVYGDQ